MSGHLKDERLERFVAAFGCAAMDLVELRDLAKLRTAEAAGDQFYDETWGRVIQAMAVLFEEATGTRFLDIDFDDPNKGA